MGDFFRECGGPIASPLSSTLLALIWACGGSVLFSITVESFCFWKLTEPIFGWGLRVLNVDWPLGGPPLAGPLLPKIRETASAKYRFVTADKCYFRAKTPVFSLRLNTSWPLKGVMGFNPNGVRIEGRPPVGTTLLLVFWLLGWTLGGYVACHDRFALQFSWIAGGCLFLALLFGGCLLIERRRLLKAAKEILRALGCPPSFPGNP